MSNTMAKNITTGQLINACIACKAFPQLCLVIRTANRSDGNINIFTKDIAGNCNVSIYKPEELICVM